jgi:hypothetical protein
VDLYVEEFFKIKGIWYGLLRSETNKNFERYVHITKFYPGGYDWMSLEKEKEKWVKNWQEKKKKE